MDTDFSRDDTIIVLLTADGLRLIQQPDHNTVAPLFDCQAARMRDPCLDKAMDKTALHGCLQQHRLVLTPLDST